MFNVQMTDPVFEAEMIDGHSFNQLLKERCTVISFCNLYLKSPSAILTEETTIPNTCALAKVHV